MLFNNCARGQLVLNASCAVQALLFSATVQMVLRECQGSAGLERECQGSAGLEKY